MASAESLQNVVELKKFLGNKHITAMLVGAAGSGKSSLINSLIKLVQLSDVSHNVKVNSYIPTASAQIMGGHTRMRESVDLTDTLTILDNRGWNDWTNEAAIRELTAQIRGERFMVDDVNWENGAEDDLSFAVSPKVDFISIVINGMGGLEAIEGVRELIETCRRNVGRRPSFVITHKDKVTDEQIDSMKATLESYAIGRQNIFVVQNFTSNDNLEANSMINLGQFIERCIIDGDVGAYHLQRKEQRTKALQELEHKQRAKGIKELKHEIEVKQQREIIERLRIKTEIEMQRMDAEVKSMRAKQELEHETFEEKENQIERRNKIRSKHLDKSLESFYNQRRNKEKSAKYNDF